MQRKKLGCVVSALLLLSASSMMDGFARGQTTSLLSVEKAFDQVVQSPAGNDLQMEQFLLARIPPLPRLSTAKQWSDDEKQLRQRILRDVVYHGWPQEWVDSAPHFELVGTIETDKGYRIRKLRYQIVPGFLATALLYEPENIHERMPAVLNLTGHEPAGIAVEYEQKRCINLAKHGIVALNMEWVGFGGLSQAGNAHDYGAQLNLVGSNVVGFFYLAMRRGLDYLATLPEVDPQRIGVTGLSGGGWQTVILSALDERVAVSVEVAGVGSRESNLTRPLDTDEVEEGAPDLIREQDYPELIAMRAPRPTLLIHNAVDSCCFRAPLVKPYIYDNVVSFFDLFGAPGALAWYENFNPGTHNYQLDNREQAYRFFTRHFQLPVAQEETFSDNELRTKEELAIAVPSDNLTIIDLARKLASRIKKEVVPTDAAQRTEWTRSQRQKLKSIVRYEPTSTVNALRVGNGIGLDFQYISYRFDFSNGLSSTGVWVKENAAPRDQPGVIVLNDKGSKFAGRTVSEHIDRGDQVLALDLLFNGTSAPGSNDPADWAMLADGSGSRPLGLEVAQLISVARWLRSTTGISKIQVETDGMRSQVIALIAAAIEPQEFSILVSRNAMRSLAYLLDAPVPIRSAPELFCLDLYKDYDLNSLEVLASPVTITATESTEPVGTWKLKRYTE